MKAPRSEQEIVERASAIAGRSIGELARRFGRALPDDLKRAKGFVGTLVEEALGADASTKPEPDFREAGVELKTIPIDRTGRPRESTYVCTVRLEEMARERWEESKIRAKLNRVLWVAVEADPELAIAARRVGGAVLWSPSADEELSLRADWEELATMVAEGYVDTITAHRGKVLQVRPKAADASKRTWGVDEDGAPKRTLPRGFYLRRTFMHQLVRKYFA